MYAFFFSSTRTTCIGNVLSYDCNRKKMQNRLMMQSWEGWFYCCCFFSLRWNSVCKKAHWTWHTNIRVYLCSSYKTLFIRHHRLYLEKWEHTTEFWNRNDKGNGENTVIACCFFVWWRRIIEKHCDFYPSANNSQSARCILYAYLSIHTVNMLSFVLSYVARQDEVKHI